jgi:hypothetical protein
MPAIRGKKATRSGDGRPSARETILEVGAEGGSLSIVRTRASDGTWRFDVLRDETTLSDMLDENEQTSVALTDASGAFDSLAAALQAMDRFPWHLLMPLKCHKEYQGAIITEVLRRGGTGAAARWQSELSLRSLSDGR